METFTKRWFKLLEVYMTRTRTRTSKTVLTVRKRNWTKMTKPKMGKSRAMMRRNKK